MSIYLEKASSIYEQVVDIRRDIHRHPELGGNEKRTSALIRETLKSYGIDKIDSPTPTSVVAEIVGNNGKGRTVALRADIDALPVNEETGLPFSSEIDGVMHACGHDLHTAMLLGSGKILHDLRNELPGTVRLIFQHSEDTMPGGAKDLVQKGVMDGVDALLGMHNLPTENDKTGVIGIRPGPFTTSADEYWFNIIGTGGHGSAPHKAPDPILAAAQLINVFQQLQSRIIDPMDTIIYQMNKIDGGHAANIIAERVRMGGNARAYTSETRDKAEEFILRAAKAVESISGCTVEVEAIRGYDACFNDFKLTEMIKKYVPEILGEGRLEVFDRPMNFSEDFSFYSTLTGIPSALMILQAGHEGDNLYTLHNAKCTVKEEAMKYGMAAMAGLAASFLNSNC